MKRRKRNKVKWKKERNKVKKKEISFFFIGMNPIGIAFRWATFLHILEWGIGITIQNSRNRLYSTYSGIHFILDHGSFFTSHISLSNYIQECSIFCVVLTLCVCVCTYYFLSNKRGTQLVFNRKELFQFPNLFWSAVMMFKKLLPKESQLNSLQEKCLISYGMKKL